MRHEVAKKGQERIELEQSYRDAAVAKSTQRQSAQCTKCHNSGHNRTRCTFATCISATICGDLKRHPDENKYLKDKYGGPGLPFQFLLFYEIFCNFFVLFFF